MWTKKRTQNYRMGYKGGEVNLMNAPPDPSISGDGDKCPVCDKPRTAHTYEEQKECFIKKLEADGKTNTAEEVKDNDD